MAHSFKKKLSRLSLIIILISTLFLCVIQIKPVFAIDLKVSTDSYFKTSLIEIHEKTYSLSDELDILNGITNEKLGEVQEIPFQFNSTMVLIDNSGKWIATSELDFPGSSQMTILDKFTNKTFRFEVLNRKYNFIQYRIRSDGEIIGYAEKLYFSTFECNINNSEYEQYYNCTQKHRHDGVNISINSPSGEVFANLTKTRYIRELGQGNKDHWIVTMNTSSLKEGSLNIIIPLLVAGQETHLR